ncbi:MBOAT family O-acyltransferase [Brevundimonas sp. 2R-24]|uniref:Probable alginate O-acetylase AlgI n=1 Tax=Peiella sedimenti TaxID=3061083 RepID=A0ABT8SLV8_9CAUL|nr:MBOAT family O-acyltransferase [Caulobacteraceae bacterium XZ-24]
MLFPTMQFGLFFLAVYAITWSFGRDNVARKWFLLLASWAFYAAWDWRFVGLLIASGLLNWWTAERIDAAQTSRRRKAWVALGVAINLTILGFFKYYGFFVEQLSALLTQVGWERDLPLLEIILPVGISFYTFQGISYVVDVHRRVTPKADSVGDVMLLMSFFPHLVAGPIVRASHLLPQFERTPKLSRTLVAHGLVLIAWGLAKKMIFATELATRVVDPVFFDPSAYGAADLALAAYAYAVQIYCDFSAYSDIAVGVAALLGYRFPRNFDQPYRATSLQEFWRRWHISLSSWLRDYLYIPLGGGRGPVWRTCINLMITMLLGGIWHGAAWTFVAWGALHGGVLTLERLWRAARKEAARRAPAIIGLLVTFHVVLLSWILFRSESFEAVRQYFVAFASNPATPTLLTPFVLVLVVGGLGLHALPSRAGEGAARLLARLPSPAAALVFAFALLLIEAVRPQGVAPFIYFQF